MAAKDENDAVIKARQLSIDESEILSSLGSLHEADEAVGIDNRNQRIRKG